MPSTLGDGCPHCERLERELAEAREAHKTELVHVSMSRDEEAQAHIEELDERCNDMVSAIEAIHAETGCEREWTNLHDLFVCVHDTVRALLSYRDSSQQSLTRSEARCSRLADVLASMYGGKAGLAALEASWNEAARAALATDGKDDRGYPPTGRPPESAP